MGPETNACKVDNTPTLELSPDERKARLEAAMRGVDLCAEAAKKIHAIAQAEAADRMSPEVIRDIIRNKIERENVGFEKLGDKDATKAITQLTDMLTREMAREGLDPQKNEGYIKTVIDNLRQQQGNNRTPFTVKAINAITASQTAKRYTQTASL